MQKLSRRNQLLIGVTLFSMFFGAGNLIFPPSLGAQAGSLAPLAFLGFAVSAAGLPALGVVAVAKSGGPDALMKRTGRGFALIFAVLIYLSIGPGLAIPRTASTSFEMAVTPFVAEASPWMRAVYSAAFFAVSLLMAMHPSKIREWLGKRLMPTLLVLIAALLIGCLLTPAGETVRPQAAYAASPFTRGVLDGYQTMDAIAALIFGMVIAMNVRDIGVTDERAVTRSLMIAGAIAGVLFVLAYGALTVMGVRAAANGASAAANGALLLTQVANGAFGTVGQAVLALIFVIACLNTCTGLICCCAAYFHGLFAKVSYRVWAFAFAAISALIANVGLDSILKLSVPVLSCLYPVTIVLIAMAFLPKRLADKTLVFPVTAIVAAIFGVLTMLSDHAAFAQTLIGWLPLAAQGLGWLVPTALAMGVGLLLKRRG